MERDFVLASCVYVVCLFIASDYQLAIAKWGGHFVQWYVGLLGQFFGFARTTTRGIDSSGTFFGGHVTQGWDVPTWGQG